VRLLALLLVLAAAPRAPAAEAPAEVVVFAAASLKEAFEALVPVFERQHPGTKVKLAFAGSQEHQTQLEHGAPADVWASASPQPMNALAKRGLVGSPVTFARNEPVIVVTRRLVVGAPEVPIGGYTLQIFAAAERKYGAAFRARLDAAIVSRELNVRQVLAKVALEEADAGIVYRTDVPAAKDKILVVLIPAELNVRAEYLIAPVTASKRVALARAFVDLVVSQEGQRRLVAAGFLPGVVAAR
jgi:molybdate transport system substrate-binding protein